MTFDHDDAALVSTIINADILVCVATQTENTKMTTGASPNCFSVNMLSL